MKTVSDGLVRIIEAQTKVHHSYSGRGMCGEMCFGYIFNDSLLDVNFAVLSEIQSLNSVKLLQEFSELTKHARCDSLGIGRRICYFPGYQTTKTANASGDSAIMERDIEAEPGFCPMCGSDQANFGDVEFQSDISYQDCSCNDCGCRWNEIYKFCRKEVVK
jgi:hypothetical protein